MDVAVTEVRAALAAAALAGVLSTSQFRSAETFWMECWSAMRPVELTVAVEVQAGRPVRVPFEVLTRCTWPARSPWSIPM